MIKKENLRPNFSNIFCQILFVVLIAMPGISNAQDLYNFSSSVQFSNHLMKTGQYSLAAEEYERIIFMTPQDDTIKQALIKSYFLNQNYNKVLERAEALFIDVPMMPRPVAIDYSRSLILAHKIDKLYNFIDRTGNLSDADRKFLVMNTQLINADWDNAQLTYNELRNSIYEKKYEPVFTAINTAKYKSPPLAAGMSAILPGSGKFYTGEWKDGLVSLLFVSAFAVQAYRGYHNYGTNSSFFIAYTSIGSIFYLGNLYGSYKSAKKYNEKVNQKIQNKIADHFIADF